MNFLNPVWAEINLDNLIHNVNEIKSILGDSTIIGVVKANGYGHGAVEISKTLIDTGIKKLAVANVVEAIELRENGITVPIIILGVSQPWTIDTIIDYNLEPLISSYEFAIALNSKALKKNTSCKCHIAFDSGMGRIGFRDIDVNDIISISKLNNIIIESVFSHFSTADSIDKEYSYYQLGSYNSILAYLKNNNVNFKNRAISNSAAIIDLKESHFEMVRPGIILYGYYPSHYVDKNKISLKPVLTLKTRISHIKEVDKDTYIGYGQTFKTDRKTVIATIPIGYADGYSRNLSNKGKVIVNGTLANIVGNICMDQLMIDITGIPNVSQGHEVILSGEDNNVKFDADDMAKILDTIGYEILTVIGRRIPRVYIKNNTVTKIVSFMNTKII